MTSEKRPSEISEELVRRWSGDLCDIPPQSLLSMQRDITSAIRQARACRLGTRAEVQQLRREIEGICTDLREARASVEFALQKAEDLSQRVASIEATDS